MGKELPKVIVENGIVYHLAENDRHRYFRMVLDGTWNEYLHEVDEECYRELEMAVKRTKEKEGVIRGFEERESHVLGG
ncbi:MAG: TnpV protein [Lachnospiraceae bacterium]|nr:TnpV protein [Lachnospiraceae bacterium]